MEIEIFDNGAWCWFQDPRALVVDDRVIATSITNDGTVRVATRDTRGGGGDVVVLREDFDRNDHNVPGLLLRNDGHLMAFYTRHSRENRMYYRVSTRPRDGTQWQEEQWYDANVTDRFTYANPFQLTAENGRIYNFWRAIDFNPTFAVSDDNGRNWSDGRNFIYFRKGQRPYVKYASNGTDTIHFAFTEAHPHDTELKTSIYHAFYRGGMMYRSDGRPIRALAERPVEPSEATQVYDAVGDSSGKGWIYDIGLDGTGAPVIAYTSCPTPQDHRYHYARWDAQALQWKSHQIAHAGTRLYEQEKYYSGGITIDKSNPSVVYLSSNVNIDNGGPNRSGRWEMYRGQTGDGGATWSWQALTGDSGEDNIRPYSPAGHSDGTFVLYMRGTYRTFTDYDTRIVLERDAGS
jgi:hypothetical protein